MTARPPLLAILGAVSIVLAAPSFASAQYAQPVGASIEPQVIQIPFPFVAGTGFKTFPAGTYDLTQPSPQVLVLRGPGPKGVVVEVQVMTRLANPSAPITESKVVFDKVGDQYYISEVWVPGADGFLVGAARDVHTHQTIKAKKK